MRDIEKYIFLKAYIYKNSPPRQAARAAQALNAARADEAAGLEPPDPQPCGETPAPPPFPIERGNQVPYKEGPSFVYKTSSIDLPDRR
jgi:hypothetical protein